MTAPSGVRLVPSRSQPNYWAATVDETTKAPCSRVLRHPGPGGPFTVLRLHPGLTADPTVDVVDSLDHARRLIHQLTATTQTVGGRRAR